MVRGEEFVDAPRWRLEPFFRFGNRFAHSRSRGEHQRPLITALPEENGDCGRRTAAARSKRRRRRSGRSGRRPRVKENDRKPLIAQRPQERVRRHWRKLAPLTAALRLRQNLQAGNRPPKPDTQTVHNRPGGLAIRDPEWFRRLFVARQFDLRGLYQLQRRVISRLKERHTRARGIQRLIQMENFELFRKRRVGSNRLSKDRH
jgi:hypothetical protein